MNYIDVKVTHWIRHRFTDDADMEKLLAIIRTEGVDAAIDDDLGFEECEHVSDTEENMLPEENAGEPTVEVYQSGKLIGTNAILKDK